jgi:hypothetical protein
MTDDADPNPGQADPNPGQLVVAAVDRCLELARTWHAWDGRPIARTMDDDGMPNTWTPHKALRRIADHLVDHLHQVEALLAGATPLPDEWLGRTVTVDADWSRCLLAGAQSRPGGRSMTAGRPHRTATAGSR